MAGYVTAKKRQREAAKRERRLEKVARRVQRKQEHEPRVRGSGDEDPDLAGIVAGPQPSTEKDE
jgi:hypothetical protein